ncbi:MAG: hypothetical protein WCK65_01695 [Rhodospirillaceae bacterium]
MARFKSIALRILILLLSVMVPAGLAVLVVGKPPTGYDVAALDAWAPIKKPGPSTQTLANAVSRLAGPPQSQLPDWFSTEDRDQLAKAETSLHADKLRAGIGHLMLLCSQLEERGKTHADVLPVVAPMLAAWLVGTYFAPLLLGVLTVVVALLVILPALRRGMAGLIKVIAGLALALVGIGLVLRLCLSLSGHTALVFSLIEYLAVVVTLAIVGNMMVLFQSLRSHPPQHVQHVQRAQTSHAVPHTNGAVSADETFAAGLTAVPAATKN